MRCVSFAKPRAKKKDVRGIKTRSVNEYMAQMFGAQ